MSAPTPTRRLNLSQGMIWVEPGNAWLGDKDRKSERALMVLSYINGNNARSEKYENEDERVEEHDSEGENKENVMVSMTRFMNED